MNIHMMGSQVIVHEVWNTRKTISLISVDTHYFQLASNFARRSVGSVWCIIQQIVELSWSQTENQP